MMSNEWNKDDPEVQSVTNFVEYLFEAEREEFTGAELQLLSANTRTFSTKVRADLESYGLRLAARPKAQHIRGFTTSSNDRWYGPGSCNSHGGSGYEQIAGFAGRQG